MKVLDSGFHVVDSGFQMNKVPQTNMPENEGSKEDLISKKIYLVDTLQSAKLIVPHEN